MYDAVVDPVLAANGEDDPSVGRHDEILERLLRHRARGHGDRADLVPVEGIVAAHANLLGVGGAAEDAEVDDPERVGVEERDRIHARGDVERARETKRVLPAIEHVQVDTATLRRRDAGDELKWIRMTSGDNEVVISTSQGQAIRFHEKDARPLGRVSRGVRGIRLRANDQVIGMDIVEEGSSIFVISKFGYGKKTKVAQFTSHARGGVGIRSAVVNQKTGELVGVKTLGENVDQEVIIISKNGQTIRLGIKGIPSLGRATQGVRIMRLNDTDEVSSLALVDKAEEIEDIDEDETVVLDAPEQTTEALTED